MQPASRTHTPPPLSGTHNGPDIPPSPPSVNEQSPYVGGNLSPLYHNPALYAFLVHNHIWISFESPPQDASPLTNLVRTNYFDRSVEPELRRLAGPLQGRSPRVLDPILQSYFLEPVLGNIWWKDGQIVAVTNSWMVMPFLEEACRILEQRRQRVPRGRPCARPWHNRPRRTGYRRGYAH